MSDILVVAEVRDGSLSKPAKECIGAARALTRPYALLVIGSDISRCVEEASGYGAERLLAAGTDALKFYSPEVYTRVVCDAVSRTGARLVLGSATALGKDLLPRAAARTGAYMVSDCTGLRWDADGLTVVRPMYAGKVHATIRLEPGEVNVVSLRPNAFQAADPGSEGATPIENIEVPSETSGCRVVEVRRQERETPELTEAEVIVTGGRGIRGPENLPLIFDLAKAWGAAVGASRAVVDAGWIDHSYQVGQTGKTVSPKLYVACAVSGAIQHLAGMRTSKFIVAINKDPSAPIFKNADYGLVGDIFEVLPYLTKRVKEIRGT